MRLTSASTPLAANCAGMCHPGTESPTVSHSSGPVHRGETTSTGTPHIAHATVAARPMVSRFLAHRHPGRATNASTTSVTPSTRLSTDQIPMRYVAEST
jgi:hypothetical protein